MTYSTTQSMSLDSTSHESIPLSRTDDPARLHVQGEGPPLIYIPGLDGTGLLFYRQARLLAHRFRVITFRLRDEAQDMETHIADVARHLDRAVPDGTPAVVVGESFGGALAMSFALAHPHRVRQLVILNSFSRIAPQFKLHVAIAGMSLVPWRTMQFARRLTAWRLQSPHTHRDEIKKFLMLTSGTTQRGYVNRLRILTRYDMRKRLAELHVPTLFLAADQDHLIPSVKQATYMSSRAPRATMRVLAGHGHGCFLAPDLDLNLLLHEWADDTALRLTGDALQPAEFRRRTIVSGFAVLVARISQALVSLGAAIVLARMLMPDDFGVFAMVVPLGIIATGLSGRCFQTALLQRPALTDADLGTFFRFAVRMNLFIAASMLAAGVALSRFFDEPRVTGVAAMWAALVFLLTLTTFQEALLKRRLLFPRITLVQLLALVLGVAAAVTAAWQGAGYWSLPIQLLVTEVTRAVGIFVLSDWRPRWVAHSAPDDITELRRAWRALGGLNLAAWLNDQPDLLAVGRVGGATVLGYYDTARRWSWYPFEESFLTVGPGRVEPQQGPR
ncbi:MAG: alpha/beta fold hydrolase [Gemmatimonadaceae bacterium]|nr:alpha/beta fold hydrolase [Gemmatimonadaceae bacterium]